MSRMVTGLFYEREEAERAIAALKAEGFAPEDIFLETEVEPGEAGAKGGEIRRAEQERRLAGMETGMLLGLTMGVVSGLALSMLSQGILALMLGNPVGQPEFPAQLGNTLLMGIVGGLIGLIVGTAIGTTVDQTLTRMGAGPAMPREETLVTVRASEANLDEVYAALWRARARHLHIAQQTG